MCSSRKKILLTDRKNGMIKEAYKQCRRIPMPALPMRNICSGGFWVMRDYVITVNSTVDLPLEWLEERNVPVIPLRYTIDGQTYTDMHGLSAKEFFAKLREGKMSTTSQVNPEEAAAMLEPYLQEGKDILHLGFSSGLSGTLNSMRVAGGMLSEKYPEARIIVIDTLCACLGEGLLLHHALKRKAEACRSISWQNGWRRISFTSAMMLRWMI